MRARQEDFELRKHVFMERIGVLPLTPNDGWWGEGPPIWLDWLDRKGRKNGAVRLGKVGRKESPISGAEPACTSETRPGTDFVSDFAAVPHTLKRRR